MIPRRTLKIWVRESTTNLSTLNWKFFIFFFLLVSLASAQSYRFRYQLPQDPYKVSVDGDKLFCLYLMARTETKTYFSKVFLDDQLHTTDSLAYELPADAALMKTVIQDDVTWHMFSAKVGKVPVWAFIVSNKDGSIRSKFTKKAEDFTVPFGHPVKLKNIIISQGVTRNSISGFLVLNLLLPEKPPLEERQSALVALNLSNGSMIWKNDLPTQDVYTTDSLLIAISNWPGEEKDPSRRTVNYINKQTGHIVKSFRFNNSGKFRDVARVVDNGKAMFMVGLETKDKDFMSKDVHMFVSSYDMQGNFIFDKVDTVNRNPLHYSIVYDCKFVRNGNMLILRSGFKFDFGPTTVNVLTDVLSGFRPHGNDFSPAIRPQIISSLDVSQVDGSILNYRSFSLDHWLGHPVNSSNKQNVLLWTMNNFLTYDLEMPDTPPQMFTTDGTWERLMMTNNGPVGISRDTNKRLIWIKQVKESSK